MGHFGHFLVCQMTFLVKFGQNITFSRLRNRIMSKTPIFIHFKSFLVVLTLKWPKMTQKWTKMGFFDIFRPQSREKWYFVINEPKMSFNTPKMTKCPIFGQKSSIFAIFFPQGTWISNLSKYKFHTFRYYVLFKYLSLKSRHLLVWFIEIYG